MADGRTPTSQEPLDVIDRRVKSIVYTGIARAHLGHIPVNREWENVCPECRGDGCPTCNHTGEHQPPARTAVKEAAS